MASLHPREQMVPRKLLWVGPLTIIITALANLVIRTIAVAIFEVSATFQYFQAPVIIFSTIIYLLLALLTLVLVNRLAQHPIRFYRTLALVALLVSLLFPIMALTGLFPVPGMSLRIFWTMIAMHIVSAIITIGLFTTLTRKQRAQV